MIGEQKMKTMPIMKIKEKVTECGNRVYILEGEAPKAGWVTLDLGAFPDQEKLFTGLVNGKADVMIHKCSDLTKFGAIYAWQPRKHEFPMMPPACPRCRYRIDYRLGQ